jgi:glycopeptide antibiotics resistance protein
MLIPLGIAPPSTTLLEIDKFVHFLIFMICASLTYLSLIVDWNKSPNRTKITVVVYVISVGLEFLQSTKYIARSFDILDLVANLMGVIFFFLIAKTLKKIVVRSGFFLN